MIKKSKLLSLLTAASIVLTSAGTYALWDTTKNETSTQVTFREPVTIKVAGDSLTFAAAPDTTKLGKAETALSNVTFNISGNGSNLANTLTLTPKVSFTGQGSVNTSNFDIKIKKDGSPLSGTVEHGFTDTVTDQSSVTYTVEVTPIVSDPNGGDALISAITTTPISLDLTATLSE